MTLKEALRIAGKAYLEGVIAQKRGNISKAAMEAGISRPTMYKVMARFGVCNLGADSGEMGSYWPRWHRAK